MESRSETKKPPSPPPASGAGNGTHEKPFTEALEGVGRLVDELKEYASYYIAARLDALKLSAKKAVFVAGLGVIGGLAAVAAIGAASVLILTGLSGGVATLVGGRVWLGDLIVGGAVLCGLGLGAFGTWTFLKNASYRSTVRKYDERQKRERQRYGHSVSDQAAREPRDRR